MKICETFDLVPEVVEQLPRGAFLTVGNDVWNPMTIGWAQFGIIWGKPIVTVMVRKSRYTFELIEKADVFTVSVPKTGELAKELAFCGSHSGRDVDKQIKTGLTRSSAKAGGSDSVAECETFFECRIVQKLFGDLSELDPDLRARYYGSNQALPDGDPHVLYFGEVLGAYKAD